MLELARACKSLGIGIISLADTVGLATPAQVSNLAQMLIREMPDVVIGVHLHSSPAAWREKVEAAWNAGCRRFDGALGGFGGCPMAGNQLVGNMNTDWLIAYFREKNAPPGWMSRPWKKAGPWLWTCSSKTNTGCSCIAKRS
ncbi:MAG: hypothetical protein MZU84_03055 [Sphingobacterium sp.]|nr:hypothetical protein [Sphingobacterium sp.]